MKNDNIIKLLWRENTQRLEDLISLKVDSMTADSLAYQIAEYFPNSDPGDIRGYYTNAEFPEIQLYQLFQF